MVMISECNKKWHKYFCSFSAIFLSAYALFLRIIKLANNKFDINNMSDEVFQAYQMKDGFISMLKGLRGSEQTSYLAGDHLIIYPFFKFFSYNKWGLAIPHIVATILGFYLLYLICERYFQTIWGYLITFIVVCFNATLIHHATEIRPYAVLPTLALATFYLSQMLVDQNVKLSISKKWGVGLFFVFVIWFHTFGILMVFSSLTFCLLTKLWDKDFGVIFKSTAMFIFIVLCIAMPFWFYSFFSSIPLAQYDKNVFEYIRNPTVDIIGFLKDIFGNLIGYKKLYFLLIGVITPFFVPYKDRFKQIAFLFITVFVPIGLIFLAAVMKKFWFVQRLFIWTMPFFAIFLGWSWESLLCFFRGMIKGNRSN